MKKLILAAALVLIGLDAHADTCIVKQADSEDVKKYGRSVEIVIERNAADVEVVFSLPSMVGEHLLWEVSLVTTRDDSEQYELFVPVSTNPSADGKFNKALLILPQDIFERADLVINYGRCSLGYRLGLQDQSITGDSPN